MNKNRNIISEIQTLLNDKGVNNAITCTLNTMKSLRIQDRVIGVKKNENCKFTNRQVLDVLLMFPFFNVKNALSYEVSVLHDQFTCDKDMFYRFVNDERVNWRGISYSVFKQLYSKLSVKTMRKPEPKCLIIDDTDIQKTGSKMEKVGRVFSHVQQKSILGFKAMFLCFSDGASQFILDASLHGEFGKNSDRPQGLTNKQLSQRYSKIRSNNIHFSQRDEELFSGKPATAINMIKRAMLEGVRFDYLLVDSWFTSYDLVKFIKSRHVKCHLLGMAKMGNTKYTMDGKDRNAAQIAKRLDGEGAVKYRRSIGFYSAEVTVKLQGTDVKLFFYRKKRGGEWNTLLSTDTSLDAVRAFKLYSRRWGIEVAHRDMKQILRLGKSQCRDFAGQIANLSLCVMQYNILSYVRRFTSYETLGGLFAEVSKAYVELTVAERVWQILIEVVGIIAGELNCDPFELIQIIVSNDDRYMALTQAFGKLAAVA